MSLHTVRRGFDIPLAGAPKGDAAAPETRIPDRLALLGADYPGMRPTLRVRPGDSVQRGAVLFEDKKTPGVRFTAPLGGRVAAIHRGARRAFRAAATPMPSARMRSGRFCLSRASGPPSAPGPSDGWPIRSAARRRCS